MAFAEAEVHSAQVLRLTNKLRQAVGKSDTVDIDESSRYLRDVIFGQGAALSREDKACLDSFVRYVVLLLGNDASAQAMSQDAAERCWDALLRLYESEYNIQDEGRRLMGENYSKKLYRQLRVLGAYMTDVSIVQPLFQSFKKLYGLSASTRRSNGADQVSVGTQETGRATHHGDKDVVSLICGAPVTPWTFTNVSKSVSTSSDREVEKTSGSRQTITDQDMQKASSEALGGHKAVVSNDDIGAVWLLEWVMKVTKAPKHI
eukprot:jgi/Picre1/30138/NNA_005507.t1